jgi:hypothetical protein
MKQLGSLHDKIIIVTGASSGIGEVTSLALGKQAASVVLAARKIEDLEKVASEITKSGGKALVVPADLTKQSQITNLVQTTVKEFGRIDVLFNNAGWGRYDWFENYTEEDIRKQFEVNVLAMAELIRQIIPIMKKQRSGHIINMSSYASRIAIPPQTIYAATKYAVEGMSDGLRRELAPWGIKVSRVHPGGVTGTQFNPKAGKDGVAFHIPIGRTSREKVASEIVKLIKNPKRELFIGRLYDIPAFLNRCFPGFVDTIIGL